MVINYDKLVVTAIVHGYISYNTRFFLIFFPSYTYNTRFFPAIFRIAPVLSESGFPKLPIFPARSRQPDALVLAIPETAADAAEAPQREELGRWEELPSDMGVYPVIIHFDVGFSGI